MKKLFLSLIIGFIVIGGLVVFQASKSGTWMDFTPSELQLRSANGDMKRIRVGGSVSEDGIEYTLSPAITLRFYLQDRENSGVRFPVEYKGIKP